MMLRRTFLAMPAALLAQAGLPGFYKRVHRLAWVTPDAAAASAAWAKLGAQVLQTFPPADLEGARVQVTVGLLGRLIIDWIQPLDGKGIFAEYLKRHRGAGVMGLTHHVPDAGALQQEVARLGAAGVKPALAGKFAAGDAEVECAFMDTAERGLYTLGLLPLSEAALTEAIRLNGVAVEQNLRAFAWGRRYAVDTEAVRRAAGIAEIDYAEPPQTLDQFIDERANWLTDYQNHAYATRYRNLVERVRQAEVALGGELALTRAVAANYHKLLAYKDEYEVARLYTDGEFRAALAQQFEGDYRLTFHLAPPLLARRHPDTGRLIKREFGPWMLKAFGLLARLRFLRGTPLDIFGYTAERRLERQLIADYENRIDGLLQQLNAHNRALAAEIAGLPEFIRGFGHVKELNLAAVRRREGELLERFAGSDRQVVRIQEAKGTVERVE